MRELNFLILAVLVDHRTCSNSLAFDPTLMLPNAAFAALGQQRKVIRCYDKYNSIFY